MQFGTGWAGLALELMSLSGQHKQNPELRLWGGGETVYRGREGDTPDGLIFGAAEGGGRGEGEGDGEWV